MTNSYRAYVIFFSAVSLVAGGVIGYFTPRPQKSNLPQPIVVSTTVPTPTPFTPTPPPIRVYISGAVRRPAVYELPPDSIVQDALDAAGGPTSDADLVHINLAQGLADQQHVYVSREGEANPTPPVSGSGESAGATVNINTATAAELEALPRIGPTMAQRIVEYRQTNGPFESIEEIQNVPGIGPATFAGFEDMITVER